MTPHTKDVVAHSKEVPCPWKGNPDNSTTATDDLDQLALPPTRVIFNASQFDQLSLKLIQLALRRLEGSKFEDPGRFSTIGNKSWAAVSKEILEGLGQDLGTASRTIADALEDVTRQWRMGILTVIAALTVIGLTIL